MDCLGIQEPQEILARLMTKSQKCPRVELLVHWQGQEVEEATWVNSAHLKEV